MKDIRDSDNWITMILGNVHADYIIINVFRISVPMYRVAFYTWEVECIVLITYSIGELGN